MNLPPETQVVRDPGLIAAPVGDELVMLSVELGKYYALNGGAAAVWQSIEQPMTVEQLCAGLQERFDVSPEECHKDVSQFLEELRDKGLLRIVPTVT